MGRLAPLRVVARPALAGALVLLSLACGDERFPAVPSRDGGRTFLSDAGGIISATPISGGSPGSSTNPGSRDAGAPIDRGGANDGGLCSGAGMAIARCGTFCPRGFHPRSFLCDTDCSPSCITVNAVTCEEDCGESFVTCGSFCPAGFRQMEGRCDVLCGDDCTSPNAFTCARDRSD